MSEIELVEGKLYSLQDLRKYLKSKGLPHSHPTIIKYEKTGLITSPRYTFNSRGDRAYLASDILQIAEILRERGVRVGRPEKK